MLVPLFVPFLIPLSCPLLALVGATYVPILVPLQLVQPFLLNKFGLTRPLFKLFKIIVRHAYIG